MPPDLQHILQRAGSAFDVSPRAGELYLDLDELPASADEILRQHPSFQDDE